MPTSIVTIVDNSYNSSIRDPGGCGICRGGRGAYCHFVFPRLVLVLMLRLRSPPPAPPNSRAEVHKRMAARALGQDNTEEFVLFCFIPFYFSSFYFTLLYFTSLYLLYCLYCTLLHFILLYFILLHFVLLDFLSHFEPRLLPRDE